MKYQILKEITPERLLCIVGACPSAYEGNREGNEVYLVVGKAVNPIDAGLENKVGDGEALIEVPRALIDERRK